MDKITLRQVPIIWTNFAGKVGQFNKKGERSFNIRIEDEATAAVLLSAGWNVKEMKQREEDDAPCWHLPVKVNYESNWPPRIYKTNEDGTQQTLLDSSTVLILDLLRVQWADVILNPYEWSVNGKSGTTAYVDTMYAVCELNPLDLEWEKREADTLLGE